MKTQDSALIKDGKLSLTQMITQIITAAQKVNVEKNVGKTNQENTRCVFFREPNSCRHWCIRTPASN